MKRRQTTLHARPWLRAGCAAGLAFSEEGAQWAVARRRRGIVAGGMIRAGETGAGDPDAPLRAAVEAARPHRPALVVAVVSGTQAPVRPLSPPLRDPRRLRPALDHLLEPQLPFDLDQVTTDHVMTLRGPAVEGNVISIACPRSESERISAAWESAGAAPSLLDHEGIALFNLARSTWRASGGWCLLALGEGRLGWVFGEDERLVSCRFVRVADTAFALAEWGRSGLLGSPLKGWAASRENCRVTGSSQARAAWGPPLRAMLGFEPEPLSPRETVLEAAAAAGAALRGCGMGLRIDLSGMPPGRRPAARPMITNAWTAAAVAAVVACVPVVGRYGRAAIETSRLRRVDRALLEVALAAGIPDPPAKQEVYALRRKLERLQQELLPVLPLAAPPAVERLDEFLRAAPADMRFERIQMTSTSAVARARMSVPASAAAFEAALVRPGRTVATRRLPAEGAVSRIEASLQEGGLLP